MRGHKLFQHAWFCPRKRQSAVHEWNQQKSEFIILIVIFQIWNDQIIDFSLDFF